MAKVFDGISQAPGTRVEGVEGRVVDRTASGVVRGRVLSDEIVYQISILWSGLTLANKTSIESDHINNSAIEFEVDISDSAGNLTTYERCQWVTMPNFVVSARAGGRFNGLCHVVGYLQ